MKSSNWWYVFCFILGGIAMVVVPKMLVVKATAQQPQLAPQPEEVKLADENVLTEIQVDGTVVHRTKEGRVVQTFQNTPLPAQPGAVPYPVASADGRPYYVVGSPPDPETAKLMNEEMQATQAAQKVLAELRSADSEGDKEKLKTQLREKLVAIFELQQKRRAAEVAKIEQRLAKLKDTMKKRDAAKDAIVDRRLDLLTGGVDELGWEETFPLGVPAPNSLRTPYVVPPNVELPLYAPPATTVPRPAEVPVLPVPGVPGTTPAPAAPPADAAPPMVPRAPTPPPGTRTVAPPPTR